MAPNMNAIMLPIEQLPHGRGLPLPAYQTPDAAGLDLLAAVTTAVVVEPGARELIPTGIRIALPPGSEGQIRPRSGLATRHGLTMANAPGTIDADYRGEIKVCLINLGQKAVVVERGMRIAQMVVAPVLRVTWGQDLGLDDTSRGDGGFGSTGEGFDLGKNATEKAAGRQP